jgi:hypothetical protein
MDGDNRSVTHNRKAVGIMNPSVKRGMLSAGIGKCQRSAKPSADG